MANEFEEWRALYNFNTSPYYPTLKAILQCVWAHRDWDSLTACPSQTTIAEECNLSRRTVTKYVGIIARLGLARPFTIGATQLKADYPALAKYAKSSHRYTVYRFDLSSEIWVPTLDKGRTMLCQPASRASKLLQLRASSETDHLPRPAVAKSLINVPNSAS